MNRYGAFLIAALWVGAVLLSGCETTVGAGKGLAYGVYASGEGAVHDTQRAYSFIKHVDEWLQENLW